MATYYFGGNAVGDRYGVGYPHAFKIIIDYAIGGKHLPDWLSWFITIFSGNQPMSIVIACAIAMVLFSAIGGLACYIDNYFTESIAQYIASITLMRRL